MTNSNLAMRVEGLGKRFTIGGAWQEYHTLRDAFNQIFSFRRRAEPTTEQIWALKDISFTLERGEVLGVIGKNGAGKSTLLKILSRITDPTEGVAEIHGRIGSLLEVGTGFHFELTGRENIFLNGAILGMKRAEIRRKFDEIVEFSEVGKYIDTPVKHYSSGMYLRLAFAVAAFLEPEILIVDEVLAVGDAAFQRKCLGKMSEVASQGRTVLFVSHNMAAIMRLCTRGLLLNAGQVLTQGDIGSVVQTYLKEGMDLPGELAFDPGRLHSARAGAVMFTAVRVRDCRQNISAQVNLSEGVNIEIDYAVRTRVRSAQLIIRLFNGEGVCVLTSTDLDANLARYEQNTEPGRYSAQCFIPGSYLRPGRYTIELVATIPNIRELDRIPQSIGFEVIDDSSIDAILSQARMGIVAPVLKWSEPRPLEALG